ncbi:hypothetical protein KC480_05630 [Bacillus velezensis]|uniref:hypothetical protein n=1 Tax=Bacillus velezensis TaxID=492670 RepID=UPI001E300541|nr:hypothetical protein [Bacillus velezensis]MCD7911004.1 hypothetical protein [Bacillus velezensis]
MRYQIQELKEEIGELEIALSDANNRTVSMALQEAIDKRNEEIEKLKPNGYVLANVTLKDGTELKRCLVFTVSDRMGTEAFSDLDDVKEIFEDEKEVYLQQERKDGNFSGDVETAEIESYTLQYEDTMTE